MTSTTRAALASAADGGGDWRELDTTPEFRAVVAAKLDQLVAASLKEKSRCDHLREAAEPAAVVRLLAGAPPLQVPDPAAEAEKPSKRPRLSGVDLQRYQLKKKAAAAEAGGTSVARNSVGAPAGQNGVAGHEEASSAAVEEGGDCDVSSDDEDMARFAEAAVPQDFIRSLATSKTVNLAR